MIEAEWNYEIYDKEMLTIVRALEDWQHYLEGLPKSFDIISNHQNLEYWRTAQDLTRCQARWSLYLSHFDFRLTHKPEVANTQADPLSHISTHLVTDADDNHDQIVLKHKHFTPSHQHLH
jgi:RNase H-like domain found in reverse transcriptase